MARPSRFWPKSWETSDDAAEWRFKIRKGVTFHNGKELTPEDVAQTLRRHSDENTKSAALGVLTDIEKLSVDGDNVVVALKRGNADLPLLLTDYHLVVQPNGGMDAPDAGIGTGPYKVEVNEPGVRHVATKYDGYWRDDVGHVASVEVLVMNDNTARMAALQSGQVHIINRVEPKTVELLRRAPGVVIESVPSKGHYVFIMHCNTAPFDNIDLRTALKLAMDREQMVKQDPPGRGVRQATTSRSTRATPCSPMTWSSASTIPKRPSSTTESRATAARSCFALPTLPSRARSTPRSSTSSRRRPPASRSRFSASRATATGTRSGTSSPSARPIGAAGRRRIPMYSTAYISGAEWNDTRFFNEKFDQLILAARAELDDAKRKAMYRDAAVMVRDEGGLILPMFNNFIEGRREEVQGWVADPNHETSNLRAAIRVWLKQA